MQTEREKTFINISKLLNDPSLNTPVDIFKKKGGGGQVIQNDAFLFDSNLDNTLPFFVESCLYFSRKRITMMS
jgi:hypothetical protein